MLSGEVEEEPYQALSDREYQVFRMIASGRTVSEIATDLCLSVKTISTHRARILEKTGFKNNAEITVGLEHKDKGDMTITIQNDRTETVKEGNHTFKVEKGQTILFHAVAGGVGLIAVQWAKHLGAEVIGVVSTDEKAEMARAQGCEHVVMFNYPDIPGLVRKLSGGEGVAVVRFEHDAGHLRGLAMLR